MSILSLNLTCLLCCQIAARRCRNSLSQCVYFCALNNWSHTGSKTVHWWILGGFCSHKIRLCQINGNEKSFNLMRILETVSQPLWRYGKPDWQILGTLKNKFQISNFLALNMKKLMSSSDQGSHFILIWLNKHKYGTPEIFNIRFIDRMPQNLYKSKHLYPIFFRKKADFLYMKVIFIRNAMGTLIKIITSDSSYLRLINLKSRICFSRFPKFACQGCHISEGAG